MGREGDCSQTGLPEDRVAWKGLATHRHSHPKLQEDSDVQGVQELFSSSWRVLHAHLSCGVGGVGWQQTPPASGWRRVHTQDSKKAEMKASRAGDNLPSPPWGFSALSSSPQALSGYPQFIPPPLVWGKENDKFELVLQLPHNWWQQARLLQREGFTRGMGEEGISGVTGLGGTV